MTAKPALLLLSLGACFDPDPPPIDAPPAVREHVMTITPNLDILFVIDDSSSMADKQDAFSGALATLVEGIAGTANIHLGVVSSDLGTSAGGGGTPGPNIGVIGNGGCSGFGKEGKLLGGANLNDGNFLRLYRNGTFNFNATLRQTVTNMTKLGAGGCGFEQQLGAMRAALDNNANNAGFLRENANLAVVVLTDEDDCTASDPSLYAATNQQLGNLDSFRCFREGVECAENVLQIGTKTQCRPRASSAFVTDVTPYREFLVGLKKNEARRVVFAPIVGDPTKVAVEMRNITGTPQLAVAHACDFTTAIGTAVADPGIRLDALARSMSRGVTSSICEPVLPKYAAAVNKLVNDTCLETTLPPASDCIVVDHLSDGITEQVPFTIVDDATCPGKQRVQMTRTAPAAFDTYATLRCAPPAL
jgi:hypothetical protein